MSAIGNLHQAIDKLHKAERLGHARFPSGNGLPLTWVDPAGVASTTFLIRFYKVGDVRSDWIEFNVAAYLAKNPSLPRYRPGIAATIINDLARDLWRVAVEWEREHSTRVAQFQSAKAAERKRTALAAASMKAARR